MLINVNCSLLMALAQLHVNKIIYSVSLMKFYFLIGSQKYSSQNFLYLASVVYQRRIKGEGAYIENHWNMNGAGPGLCSQCPLPFDPLWKFKSPPLAIAFKANEALKEIAWFIKTTLFLMFITIQRGIGTYCRSLKTFAMVRCIYINWNTCRTKRGNLRHYIVASHALNFLFSYYMYFNSTRTSRCLFCVLPMDEISETNSFA